MNEDINSCTFTGYLVKDPKFQYTPQGMLTVRFAIRQKPRRKVNGEWVGESQFINFDAIGKTAERIKDRYQPGTEVTIGAEYRVRKYEVSGQNRYAHEFFVRWIRFPAPPSNFANETIGQEEDIVYAEADDDDMPF